MIRPSEWQKDETLVQLHRAFAKEIYTIQMLALKNCSEEDYEDVSDACTNISNIVSELLDSNIRLLHRLQHSESERFKL